MQLRLPKCAMLPNSRSLPRKLLPSPYWNNHDLMAATYYELLGIPEDADAASIAKAFRKEIQKSHPDLNQSDGTAMKHSQLLKCGNWCEQSGGFEAERS